MRGWWAVEVLRENFAEDMIQNKELKKQEEAVQCMDKDLEHLSLDPASWLLPAVSLLCDFGQVS